MPTIQLGSSWGPMQQADVITWLHELAGMLAVDARRAGVSDDLRRRITTIATAMNRVNDATPEETVTSIVNSFTQALGSLGANARITPPIDVAIPSMIDTRRSGAPREIDKSAWPEIVQSASRVLPSSDALRGAIDHWASWSEGALPSTALTDFVSERAPSTTRTEAWNERHRARRLAAWVTDRLVALGGMRAELPDLPSAPVSQSDGAPAAAPALSSRRKSSDGGGWGIIVVIAGVIFLLRSRK